MFRSGLASLLLLLFVFPAFVCGASQVLAGDPQESAGAAENTGSVRLALPPEIPAVVGLETNLYFDNAVLVLNPANYAFDVICAKGRQQVDRWALTPLAADVGVHDLTLEVRDQSHTVVARGKTRLRVVPADAGADASLSLLLIGDSLTHASVYPQHLLQLCDSPGNPRVTLLGTHGPGETLGAVRHEGYGGWTARRFATHFTGTARAGDYRQRGSPFLYADADGKPQLDFRRYCMETNGGQLPDVVAVFLGPNDVFGLDESGLEAGIQQIIGDFDVLFSMVRSAGPEVDFAVLLPVPPAATQDAFGANYGSGQTRWQYRRNQHRLLECLLERFAGRESEHVHVVPTHLNLDCVHNYPAVTEPANLRSSVQLRRLNNGVHPAAEGYLQIGDSLYAWLKAMSRSQSAAP